VIDITRLNAISLKLKQKLPSPDKDNAYLIQEMSRMKRRKRLLRLIE